MLISIVTPSRNNSEWLKLCVASVADQGEAVEHIVQDGGSTDGTLTWLLNDSRVKARSERDRSMYEAINSGLARANGDVLGYLNCDEQFLPGSLGKVRRYFEQHPEVEIVFGDAIVVEADGRFICYRKVVTPHLLHTWINGNLSIFTCATFFRRSILDRGLIFNPDVRMVGDTEWLLRVIRSGAHMGTLQDYTSAFTMTGANIGFTQEARREHEQFYGSAPKWAHTLKGPIIWNHWLRRFWNGAYRQPPFHYSIYTRRSPTQRQQFFVDAPTFRWRGAGYVETPLPQPTPPTLSNASIAQV
jgi:glycosyltransferase involved in cell wall biosynthesis